MTQDVVILIRHDFDNMENRNAERKKIVGVILSDEAKEKTALEMAYLYINNMKPFKTYLGWDDEIYPKYEAVKVNVLSVQ